MFKFVILLSALACALGAAIPEGMLPQLDGRIVGGYGTTIGAFPWQISLMRNNRHSCGGAILNNRIIVTAAHCLQGGVAASSLTVRVGSTYSNTGGVVHQVNKYKNHEGYNANTMANDIAVISLKTNIAYNGNAKAINMAVNAPGNGAAAVVSGWGALSSGGSSPTDLRAVNLNIVGRSQCSSGTYSYGNQILSSMICAAAVGKDACQGDSGGPLVSGGNLVGVVSWGYGCAQPKYPGVYADVAVLRNWVNNNLNNV